jgi:hypothetical protein
VKKYLKYVFALFSFGLTLISMQSGFYFYKILFGISTAILATGVFEILRLATLLYLSMNLETKKRVVAAILYVMVALICAFAATSSFHARVIESYERDILPYATVIEGRVGMVQQKYAQMYAEKVVAIEEKIEICKKKTILLPESTYWPKRLSQLLEERHEVVLERDSIISSVPNTHVDEWVSRHSAITGITFDALPLSKLGAAAITAAVQELWDIGELSVKKLVALAIVLAIEIGIILLAIFARIYAIETSKKTEEMLAQKEEILARTEEMLALAESTKKSEKASESSLQTAASETKEFLHEEVSSPVEDFRSDELLTEVEEAASETPDQPFNEQKHLGNNGRPQEYIADLEPEKTDIPEGAIALEAENKVENDLIPQEMEETAEPSPEKMLVETEAEKESEITNEDLQETKEAAEALAEGTHMDAENDITHTIMKKLQVEFREDDIERFLKINGSFFKETGKLIPANRLTRRLQPIRRMLNKDFTKKEVQIFLSHYAETANEILDN